MTTQIAEETQTQLEIRLFREGHASRNAEVAELKRLNESKYADGYAQAMRDRDAEVNALLAKVAEKGRLLKVALEAGK